MSDRYFSDDRITGSGAVITGADAHHLLHVMRAKPGDQVTLFDGSGNEFLARVEGLRRDRVEFVILESQPVDRESPLDLTIGVALPKGDRQRWLVEKAAELGVARLIPIVTQHTVSLPVGNALGRLRRTVVEASKQCGRNRLMQITEPMHWKDFIVAAPEAAKWLAHPASRTPGNARPKLTAGPSAVIAIGPEGGFTLDEVHGALAADWQPIDLGPRILRIETAALVLASLVLHGHP